MDRVELEDGDFIDLIWYGRERMEQPLVLILHGLEGGDDSHYVRSIVRTLRQAKFRVVMMFHRGCSAEHNRLARSYHSGETDDMAQVMRYLKANDGKSIYAAIGYSLGANALLKYLGEQGDTAEVDRAIAVSAPFDLYAASLKLNQGVSKIYQHHLVKRLIQRYQDKFKQRASPIDVDVCSLTTFIQFDEHITAALNGFDGAIDYYTRSSSQQYLAGIRKPCLIIHSADDPFLPASAIPAKNKLPAWVQLQLSEQGGHVGFLEGWIKPRRWVDKAVLMYLGQA